MWQTGWQAGIVRSSLLLKGIHMQFAADYLMDRPLASVLAVVVVYGVLAWALLRDVWELD